MTVLLLLTACGSLSKPLTTDNPPVNSMAKCPVLVKDGNYKDFGQVLLKLTDVIYIYNTCAQRHEALVDYNLKANK